MCCYAVLIINCVNSIGIFISSPKHANFKSLDFINKTWSNWCCEWIYVSEKLVGPSDEIVWTSLWSVAKTESFQVDLGPWSCPQRQVRHPFVHDLQDCWQTQRHLYISESARDQWPIPTQMHYPKPTYSHLNTRSLVQNLPTIPYLTPKTWKDMRVQLSLFILLVLPRASNFNPCNPATPVDHCLCILYPLCPLSLSSRAVTLVSKSATDSESVTQFVCFPAPLWKASALARGPDVEHCCGSARTHMPQSEETPLLA